MKNITLVLGASENTERYSNKAIKKLLNHNHNVKAIGNKIGEVNGVTINKGLVAFNDIDTVTLYLNPTNQKPYYDYILSLKPRRVIFNPGTENDELQHKLNEAGIAFEEACTLVLLSTNQY
ncbi:CoA-binding protein [Myroides sp. JBRI-B21084]|uniref:CoA-binding protein n=1 Tax=Myroides sp. JBRI-B21084 TaxID=3119977 RepID=UPI0026E4510C|nr:CoA-binding protein [Paenimyroides cloacae]WKW45641.1 CoA-binding protein [Paenimyroides cloacae]